MRSFIISSIFSIVSAASSLIEESFYDVGGACNSTLVRFERESFNTCSEQLCKVIEPKTVFIGGNEYAPAKPASQTTRCVPNLFGDIPAAFAGKDVVEQKWHMEMKGCTGEPRRVRYLLADGKCRWGGDKYYLTECAGDKFIGKACTDSDCKTCWDFGTDNLKCATGWKSQCYTVSANLTLTAHVVKEPMASNSYSIFSSQSLYLGLLISTFWVFLMN